MSLAITALGESLTNLRDFDPAAGDTETWPLQATACGRRYSFSVALSSAMNRFMRSSSTGRGTEPMARMAS
jgi:hypothetical protein